MGHYKYIQLLRMFLFKSADQDKSILKMMFLLRIGRRTGGDTRRHSKPASVTERINPGRTASHQSSGETDWALTGQPAGAGALIIYWYPGNKPESFRCFQCSGRPNWWEEEHQWYFQAWQCSPRQSLSHRGYRRFGAEENESCVATDGISEKSSKGVSVGHCDCQ